ncbi:PrsW family intramembrane metalloprotease [Demequina sediminicola]|uniref:PrsW family intramembrane metalloprotease n=1 Tax=Demequina sediminicola TaxID=1095026 RepID=UPI00078548BE|nr:PrsW family intramembrane metalloprotease [Demequina sediminicola]
MTAAQGAVEPAPATVAIATIKRALPRTSSFIDTRSAVFWAGCAITLYGLLTWMPLVFVRLQSHPTTAVLSAIAWLLYGFVFMMILYRMELFERRSPVTVLGALAWGGLAAPGVAAIAAPAMHDIVAVTLPVADEWVSSFAAPLVEEPLKWLGVVALALIPGARLRSAADGLFYGAVIGLGFQVSESFLYTAVVSADGTAGTVFAMVMLRGVVGGLWNHPTYSAMAGAGVGYFFNASASAVRRWAVMLGTLALAMAVHGFFNTPIVNGNVWVSSVTKGIPVLLLFLGVLRWAHLRERRTFAGLAAKVVPDDLVSPADFRLLATRRTRREVRRAAARISGLPGKRALTYLQGAQLSLLTATHEDGWGSPRTIELSEDVRELHGELGDIYEEATGSRFGPGLPRADAASSSRVVQRWAAHTRSRIETEGLRKVAKSGGAWASSKVRFRPRRTRNSQANPHDNHAADAVNDAREAALNRDDGTIDEAPAPR